MSYGVKTLPDRTPSYGKENLTPELAESWQVVSDGMSCTFKLRKDATFHDGTPVTAKDVKWSFDRAVSVGGFPTFQMSAGAKLIDKARFTDDKAESDKGGDGLHHALHERGADYSAQPADSTTSPCRRRLEDISSGFTVSRTSASLPKLKDTIRNGIWHSGRYGTRFHRGGSGVAPRPDGGIHV